MLPMSHEVIAFEHHHGGRLVGDTKQPAQGMENESNDESEEMDAGRSHGVGESEEWKGSACMEPRKSARHRAAQFGILRQESPLRDLLASRFIQFKLRR